MAVKVFVGGRTTSNITSFSVQEDATPIDPSSSAGGVGQITVGLDDYPDAPRIVGEVVITDGARGKTSGNVRSASSTDGVLSLTADSVLGRFNTDRTALPFNGTLGGAIQYYSDLVDIPNDVLTDATISSRPVVYPGFKGNVWVFVKQLLAKEQIEMALVFNRVYVRPLRILSINKNRHVSKGWSVDDTNAARTVEVNYYNNVYGAQQEVFPIGPNADFTPISVDAGETIVITQQLNASLISVNQPVVQNSVLNKTYEGTSGVYAVSGNDGLPITAAQWTAQGGKVEVRLTDDPSVIEISITGASMTQYAPYRIAMSSGASNYYNALHVTGTGVSWNMKTLTLRTGVPDDASSVQVGVTVDNKFISTLSDAYNMGLKAAQAYAGLNYTINGTALDLNREGQGTSLITATVEDFNLAYPAGTTVAAFNAIWVGQDIHAFNLYWANQVDLLWENQLFGNAPGARVLDENDANFRVTSATTTEGSVQYTASLDTIVSDFNTVWAGATVADFNAQFAGASFKDFNPTPLRRG